ncbi:MAG TPA: flagellin [Syntrophomonas sp.]|nr:flagellin [Syntrophomonas sp.]
MIINNNIAALNTFNQLSKNDSSMAKSLEKLSSGYQINTAADDAAGLAISQKMQAQINGLNQADDNTQDASSLIQTAEGALNQTNTILQRMRELAVQAANDTLTDDDREYIQTEYSQLMSQIDQISTSTEFNTKKLLNGDSGNKVIYSSNPNVASATVTSDNIVAGSYQIAVTTAAEQATIAGTAISDSIALSGPTTVVINNQSITFEATSLDADATAAAFMAAVNNSTLGITATYNAGGNLLTLTNNAYGSSTITVSGSAEALALGLTTGATTDNSDTGVDVEGTIGGAAATGSGTTLVSTAGDAFGLKVTLTGTAAAATNSNYGTVQVTKNALTMQTGANEGQTMTISLNSMGSVDLGINNIDLSSRGSAATAISTLDAAISRVSAENSRLGAYENRLDYTSDNLTISAENLTAADANIRDVDMAKEMMEYTKYSILSQAATSMLAQANQMPQNVLKLLQ